MFWISSFLKSCAMYLRESCDRQIIISFLSFFYFPYKFDYKPNVCSLSILLQNICSIVFEHYQFICSIKTPYPPKIMSCIMPSCRIFFMS
nr:MAG TPA: hypothetical protein [Caudoviricetes sp.]